MDAEQATILIDAALEEKRQDTLAQVREEVEKLEGFGSGMVEEPVCILRSEVLAILDRLSSQ